MTIDLYHDDCLNVLSQMRDQCVDVAFLDPPYGTGNDRNKVPTYSVSPYMMTRNWQNFYSEWDGKVDPVFTYSWLKEVQRVLKPTGCIWICGTFHNLPITGIMMELLGWYTVQWVQWVIPNAMPHLAGKKLGNANQTLIWARPSETPGHLYNYTRAKAWNKGKNLRDFWPINYETEEEWEVFFRGLDEAWTVIYNSTQAVREMPALVEFKAKKPYKLIARALDLTLPDDRETVVLDCFAGSGTTGVVCNRMNEFIPIPRQYPIHCILVEEDRKNVEQFIVPRLHIQPIEGEIDDTTRR